MKKTKEKKGNTWKEIEKKNENEKNKNRKKPILYIRAFKRKS